MLKVINIKKAAMFGLDARIALAIFGALSVISGAALYSAIKQSKLIAYQVEINEISKAVESYILDTGSDLTSSGVNFKITDLIKDSGVKGWNGPYISGVEGSNNLRLLLPGTKAVYYKLKKATDVTWNFPEVGGTGDGTCGKPCFYWIEISIKNRKILEELDIKIDGALDKSNGLFRIYTVGYAKSIKTLMQ